MYRKILLLLILFGCLNCFAKELKVLMIGNSFSVSVKKYLPQLVANEKKHTIELTSAYIGGCVLQRHADNLKKAEADTKFTPYEVIVSNSSSLKEVVSTDSVNNLLKNNQYDIITIQQGSPHSWDYAKYQPYADEIITYIRKYNPDAEIIIQQTWAYRADNSNIAPPNPPWNFGQAEMHKRVIEAYEKLAKDTNFRLIPTGMAVYFARNDGFYEAFVPPTPEELATYKYPKIPSVSSDVVGYYYYRTGKNGEKKLIKDTIHLNSSGEFLQACVWYSVLFNENALDIQYIPKWFNDKEWTFLKNCAFKAVEKYKHINTK